MKKLLFALLLLPIFVQAQSIQNLDLKNGFLQFHLGDSLLKYKNDLYVSLPRHPDENVVRPAANPMRKYFDRVMLVSVNGIVTEIHLYLREEKSIQYFDGLIKQAYGPGEEKPNPDQNAEGNQLVYTGWTGQRVTLMLLQTNINRVVGGPMTSGRIQAFMFKKTSEAKVGGELPEGFAL